MKKQIEDKAKELFYNKEYSKAISYFKKINDDYSTGLCYLLLKDEKYAKKHFEHAKKSSPAANWGLCVLDFINLRPSKQATFFQTRAFLEVYLNLFIENHLIEYAQNLISSSDSLYFANPESYKFIARALFANGYFPLAITFCEKSLRIFYSDPEALLILSQCLFLIGKIEEAKTTNEKILKIAPDYYPSKLFKVILENQTKN